MKQLDHTRSTDVKFNQNEAQLTIARPKFVNKSKWCVHASCQVHASWPWWRSHINSEDVTMTMRDQMEQSDRPGGRGHRQPKDLKDGRNVLFI
jgi:hypothetical protein